MKKLLIAIIAIIILIISFFSIKNIFFKKTIIAKPIKTTAIIADNTKIQKKANLNTTDTINQDHIKTNIKSGNVVSLTTANNDCYKIPGENLASNTIKISTHTSAKKVSNSTNSKINQLYTHVTGTKQDLEKVKGIYLFDTCTLGNNSNLSNEISNITINSKGIKITNDWNGSIVYSSNDSIQIWHVEPNSFKTIFGQSLSTLGLPDQLTKIYSIGKVFLCPLPNRNIVFSYECVAGTGLDTTNNRPVSNISKWYGNYKITNKVGQINGINTGGVKPINLTGKTVSIQSKQFIYGTTNIKNPDYYIFSATPHVLGGSSFTGIQGINGKADFIAVMPSGYTMSNQLYDALPAYIGCTSGAWAANIAMPVILAPNGTVQVMNNNGQVYATSKTN